MDYFAKHYSPTLFASVLLVEHTEFALNFSGAVIANLYFTISDLQNGSAANWIEVQMLLRLSVSKTRTYCPAFVKNYLVFSRVVQGRRLVFPRWTCIFFFPSSFSPPIRRIRREMNRCRVSQALSQHARTDRLVDSDIHSASHRMCRSLVSPSAGFQRRRNSDESPTE